MNIQSKKTVSYMQFLPFLTARVIVLMLHFAITSVRRFDVSIPQKCNASAEFCQIGSIPNMLVIDQFTA